MTSPGTFKIALAFCFTCLAAIQGYSQDPGYRSFPLEKDNRQININCIQILSNGYLYVGSDEGVFKFDGERYHPIAFADSSLRDTVTAMFQDRGGKLWLGFRSGRLANIINKRIVALDPEEGLPQKRITCFVEDQERTIWFGTAGEGLYYIRNGRFYLVDLSDGLSDLNVSSLALAANGDVLAGTDQGLNICRLVNGKKQVQVFGPREGLPDYIVTSLAKGQGSFCWVGLQDKGFCRYDARAQRLYVPAGNEGWRFGQVNSLFYNSGKLYVATQDSGMMTHDVKTGITEKQKHSLVRAAVKNIHMDLQGNLWASSPEGLIRSPGDALKLLPIPGHPAFEHVHAILCDRNGSLWLNNEENELIKLNRQEDVFSVIKIHLPGLHRKTDITALYQDTTGAIWIGTMGKGVFILDPNSLQFRAFTEEAELKEATVLSISGHAGSVFISTLQGALEIHLGKRNGSISNRYAYTKFETANTGTNYVYSIFRDSQNRTWFGTDGRGLTVLVNNKYTNYNKPQLKDDRIYSIAEDNGGNIWFSTAGAGIYKFDGKNFTNFDLSAGLTDLDISSLRRERTGRIVIVHSKGIDVLNPSNNQFLYLGSSQGIAEVNSQDLGAITTDTSGNIMVSTRDGILTYSYPQHSVQTPTVLIESVQLFMEELDEGRRPVFDHDENNFTFSYTGLYYSSPDKIYYKYKLEGLDSNWIITRDRSRTFPKLAPGKYRFRIQAALNRNFLSSDEASYAFTIRQAFYNTWWFISACAGILIALIYLYFKAREKRVKRTALLKQEKVQTQLEMLRNQVNPHFLFNSFNTLISAIEDEPKMAAEYAAQLSDFFRNIVNQRDRETISLREEISALDSYFYLQQKRYGDNLELMINVPEEARAKFRIAPLSLQLLLENAIKHNAISRETPLKISIVANAADYLEVRNNVNPRSSMPGGTGMGLQNIIHRYELLTQRKVRLHSDDKFFIVSLPLLKS